VSFGKQEQQQQQQQPITMSNSDSELVQGMALFFILNDDT